MTLPLLCHGGATCPDVSTALPAFIMGIVNVTPDSFWSGSRFSASRAAERALELVSDGADIIDIGGESTRPGSDYVREDEEIRRVVPVVEEIRRHSDCPVSVDTRKLGVMRAAHEAGADILNDVSALADDPALADYAAAEKLPVILMHKRGIPVIMQEDTDYADSFAEVDAFLSERAAFAMERGIARDRIIVDPGIGFGKDLSANAGLIRRCGRLCGGGFPVLMALSRKSCIGEITGRDVEGRGPGTLAANLLAVRFGASILRVHDVRETYDMLCVLEKLGGDCA